MVKKILSIFLKLEKNKEISNYLITKLSNWNISNVCLFVSKHQRKYWDVEIAFNYKEEFSYIFVINKQLLGTMKERDVNINFDIAKMYFENPYIKFLSYFSLFSGIILMTWFLFFNVSLQVYGFCVVYLIVFLSLFKSRVQSICLLNEICPHPDLFCGLLKLKDEFLDKKSRFHGLIFQWQNFISLSDISSIKSGAFKKLVFVNAVIYPIVITTFITSINFKKLIFLLF